MKKKGWFEKKYGHLRPQFRKDYETAKENMLKSLREQGTSEKRLKEIEKELEQLESKWGKDPNEKQ